MFEFREEDHSYWLDGRRLESVTEILSLSGIADYRWSNEESMTRGSFVHRATEYIDKGSLDWTTLDDTLRPYCEAYQRFVEDKRPEIILSEKPMYHATYLYSGKPDRVFLLDGVTSLIDLKTGAPNRATQIQMAAYREMIRVSEDIHCAKCFSLHLRDDGTYRLDEIKDLKRNFQIFLGAMTVERWKKGEA
jgi:hypothetical protein